MVRRSAPSACTRQLITLSVLAATAGAMLAEAPQVPAAPDNATTKQVRPIDSIFVESRDLRLLLCTPEALRSREQKKVCVVDTITADPTEVPVDSGDTVRDVLKKSGMGKKTSQARLVTENSIEQNSRSVPLNKAEGFLSRRVSAGDILVLAAQQ